MTRPNTPGLAGYLLGVGVSFLVCAPLVLVWLNAGSGPEGWVAAALYLPIALVEVSTYGLPVALAGVVLVHAACSLVPWQWVHVVVTGATPGEGYYGAYTSPTAGREPLGADST